MIREFGADTIRVYLLASSQVWLPKRFDRRTIPEVAGGFFNTLRNTYGFFSLYAGDWRPTDAPPLSRRTQLDRWLLSRLDATVEAVTGHWSGYDVTAGTRAIMDFVVDDLSNWYVRLSRSRFWAPDREADAAAVATLHEALVTVARLLAPAAPFVSDWLHRALAGTSVHLERFPVPQARGEPSLEAAMDGVRRLASLARAVRNEASLPVRQPLRRMYVAVPAAVRGVVFDQLLELLRLEVNVKAIEVVSSDAELVRLKAKPNYRALGKRYGSRTPDVASAVAELTQEQLRALERGESVTIDLKGEAVTYLPEDVIIEREVASQWLVKSEGPYVVALDPELDEALRGEGFAREVVNRVQRLRKEAGYAYTTRIHLWIDGGAAALEALRPHGEFIQEETLARSLELGARASGPDGEQRLDMDGLGVVLGVRRYEERSAV
jgi:isoleucyl-tRNA synthetase